MTDTFDTRQRNLLMFIVGIAIALRATLAVAHPFFFPDSADYQALGRALLHGGPYRVNGLWATRIPGYPLFVAAVYFLCGPSVRAVLLVQAAMGGAIVWLTWLIGRRAGTAVGLLAALLAAIDPLSIGFSAALLSETPFTLLFLLGIWLFIRWTEDSRLWRWPLIGAVWGAAVYMRASVLYCILPLGAWALWCAWRSKPPAERRPLLTRGAAGLLLAILVMFASLIPWQARNYAIFHSHFFRITTLEGISLYEAVYPEATGAPRQDIIRLPADMRHLNEAQRNDEWSRRAWHYVFSDPLRIARLAFRKMGRTWSPWLNAAEFRNPAVQALLAAWHIPLFAFALLGLFAGRIRLTIRGLLLLPLLYFTAVHSLFLGSVRYRVPLMPLVCIFAAAGILRLAPRRSAKPPVPATV